VHILLQLDPAAHVVDDDCREAAFLDQWHLGGDSLLRCDGVEAGAVAQSLPLDLRRAAKCTSAVSVESDFESHTSCHFIRSFQCKSTDMTFTICSGHVVHLWQSRLQDSKRN